MELTTAQMRFFRQKLSDWHTNHNSRELPWKGEQDPYRIWLSEVILQQTRAQQGLPYYEQFTATYPDIKQLAAAQDEDVFRLWQGLGYYNRCRNMLATARYIAHDLDGRFPDTHETISALKGVGPYTAAAIASFAFGLPYAVVDGNVYRVLSRFWGIDTPFDTTKGKAIFASVAQQLLDKENSAAYNQAIMDFGATVCTPAAPDCANCMLSSRCFALEKQLITALPVRSKRIKVRERHFNYILLIHEQKLWIERRRKGDIWEDLHQPYVIETEDVADEAELRQNNLFDNEIIKHAELVYAGEIRQRLTHQLIHSRFYTMHLKGAPDMVTTAGIWVSINELNKLAFPKTLVSFLKNNLYF